ncbi:UbiA prenyltransferase family [Fomes fomentarius]|nr:UbiA prenyltransferase family [Fomes fomentarius]
MQGYIALNALRSYPTAIYSFVAYHAYSIILFTAADVKTILIPISAFACAAAPLHSFLNLICGMMWIWVHQLMCNVSNQAGGCTEDALNKPWRPIPSGRISPSHARALRWIVAVLCIITSAAIGSDMVMCTLALLATTFLYDELGLSSHHMGKNFCNIGGYTSIEVGATKLMGGHRTLDSISIMAVCISGLLIFTTIQAQDFADVAGDRALGRTTFPIYAPELSRIATLCAIIAWSILISRFWNIGPACMCAFIALGAYVALRYYFLRNAQDDKVSYVLYNVWITLAHLIPLHARCRCFSV